MAEIVFCASLLRKLSDWMRQSLCDGAWCQRLSLMATVDDRFVPVSPIWIVACGKISHNRQEEARGNKDKPCQQLFQDYTAFR